MCVINSSGLAHLLYFLLPTPRQRVGNGSIIASITFVILSLLFFKLNSAPQEVTESMVTAGF